MTRKIDYDRGVIIRQHPTGVDVFMYVDDPGVYLSAHGTTVNEALAKASGFPTEDLGREKKIRDGLSEYERQLRSDMQMPKQERKVIKELHGFQVIELGTDRCQVLSPEGVVLHKGLIPNETALNLLGQLATTEVAK